MDNSIVGAALLPKSEISTTMPSVTGRTITVAAGGDLQAAINSAQPGDQIVLAAGAVFTGPYTLPNKAGNGWITIRSAGPLPSEGTRATAADVVGMATLLAPGSNGPALQTAPGAHNYRIVGLNITAAAGVSQMTSLVNLGSGNSDQNTVAAEPQNIIIDRSYIHGSDSLDLRRGVALNSANSAVINSTISDVHSAASDSQAIAGWNGTGPYLIQNNFLEASGENVMFGGANPSIPNALPSDITIRGNDFYKPPSWKGKWEVKNLLELKLGQRVLVENNNFQNSWVDAQSGFAINLKSSAQGGTAPWSNTSNVTIRNNVIQNAVGGISIAASPDPGVTVPASNFSITGNTFKNMGGTPGSPAGTLFQLLGYGGALKGVTIASNTAVEGDANLASTLLFDGSPTQGLNFSNNILTQGLSGIKGSGAGEGAGTIAAYAPGATFSGNTLIGGSATDYGSYAAGNLFPSSYTQGNSPQPSPIASPQPSPVASPQPGPVASPQPSPIASPQPSPVASPQPSPIASPQPSPVASPQPGPIASPQPSPVASPQPSPIASPQPSPVASPQPSPIASPQPSPVASPQPSPIASPQPSPVASPQPGATGGAPSTVSGLTDPTTTTTFSGGRFQGKHYSSFTDTVAPNGTQLNEVKNFDDGSHRVELFRRSQTLRSIHNDNFVIDPAAQGGNTFVFSHGFGVDTIHGFNLTGAGHDTLDLLASDFTSIADMLRHTHSTGFGSAITDPVSHDVVRLVGVSKAALVQNQNDFKLM